MKKLLFFITITVFLLVACSAPVAVQSPVTAAPISLPATANPMCGTVVTMIKDNPPSEFGQTKIQMEFVDFSYDGIVAGGGFVEPANGAIKEVHIGGKNITLTRNDFSDGSIHTEKFGNIKVLFTANLGQECALLVATPEQVTQISDWLR
jgi:hypothetical protein